MDRSLKIAFGSLFISTAVLTIKYAAYWVTGSVALLSDALESIINVVSRSPSWPQSRSLPHHLTKSTPTATIRRNTCRRSSLVLDHRSLARNHA